MLDLFINIIPKFEVQNKCEQLVCQQLPKSYGDKFIEYVNSVHIEGYCLGCNGERGRYDCSAFISNYLIQNNIINRRINSYILSQYGIQKDLKDIIRGDLVVMYNKGTGANHTAIFRGYDEKGIQIYDLYEKETKRSVRYIGRNTEKYKVYFIGNPVEYGFKQSFYREYRNFIGE